MVQPQYVSRERTCFLRSPSAAAAPPPAQPPLSLTAPATPALSATALPKRTVYCVFRPLSPPHMCIATDVAAPAPGRSSGSGRRLRCPRAQAPPPSLPDSTGLGDRIQLERILFDTCSNCSRSQVEAMSSIPQGTLAMRAVSANQKKVPMDAGVSEFVFEHPPLKYSSKLMNSIWGLYNRYSVHNFKKNMNVDVALCGMQQQRFLAAASL